jgi:CRISPR-associated endonuclease Cas1
MLNYGYAMAASQVRAHVMAVGLDPSIGIMHGNRHNKMPLVSDLMESLRPVVDEKILGFVAAHTFHPADFTINSWGGCRLNPQLAKVVANKLAAIPADQPVNGFLKNLL